MSLASLQASLRGVRRLALDTSVWLAASDPDDPRRSSARWLLEEVERGRFAFTVISTLTVAEALVRAVGASFEEGATAQTALRIFPNLTIAPLDFDTAVEVAHIRGATKLKMPDAIVLGTAIAHQVEAIVHADEAWVTRAKPYASALKIVYLGSSEATASSRSP